jgi:hypothetical protein
MQDFMIKTNTKSKVANAITKKLKGSKKADRSSATSRLKDDDCCEATSRSKTDDELNLNLKSDEEEAEVKDI